MMKILQFFFYSNFFNLCKYDYYSLVKILLDTKWIDINKIHVFYLMVNANLNQKIKRNLKIVCFNLVLMISQMTFQKIS